MNLDILRNRKLELDQSAQKLSDGWQVIQGQKAEIDYWIAELEKTADDATKVVEPVQ